MTSVATQAGRTGMKPKIALLIALGVAIFIAANAHLLYVAMTSQPDCVAHVRRGEEAKDNNSFSAAASSCSPKTAKSTPAAAE
jgi:flagellar basal body-associated protein FliL